MEPVIKRGLREVLGMRKVLEMVIDYLEIKLKDLDDGNLLGDDVIDIASLVRQIEKEDYDKIREELEYLNDMAPIFF